MVDVFVSYASKDRERVRPLVERLIAEGWTVWWDRHIGSGAAWDDEIEKALETARCVLVAWSDAAISSEWVRTEAHEAARRNRLVPVLLDRVLVPLRFRRIQSRRLIGWPEVHDPFELAHLFTDVRNLVEAATVASSSPPADFESPSRPAARSERRSITMLRVELIHPDGAWEDPEQLVDATGAVRAMLQRELDPQVSLFQDLDDTGFVCLFGVPMADELAEVHGIERALRLGQSLKNDLALDWRMALADGIGVVSPHAPGEAPRVTTGLRPRIDALLRKADAGQLVIPAAAQRRLAPFFETRPAAGGDFVVTSRTKVRDRMTASEVLGLSPLSGRQAEIAEITRCADAAAAGSGQAISLVADDGVGKSRMLHEAAGQLAGGNFRVLRMAGDAHARSISHAAFAEALGLLLGIDGEVDEAAIVSAWPPLAPYAPFLAQVARPDAPENASEAGMPDGVALNAACREAILAAVTLAAAQQPVALIFDDYQFADQAAQETLVALAGAIAHSAVLLIVAARPDAPPTWPATAHCRQMVLSPLDVEATGLLLKTVAGARAVVPGLAAIIRRRTDGVPFFIEELCRALIDAGEFSVVDGKLTTRAGFNAIDVPHNLEGLVRARLDQLQPHVRAVVQTAGVIGQQFEWSALRDLMGLDGPATLHLGPAIAVGIVQQVRLVPEPVYRFPQQLMQVVARDSILVKERRELHRRIASALEADMDDLGEGRREEVAFHFAEAGCDDKAVEHLLAAARHALHWGSAQVASELAYRAVQLLEVQPAAPARDGILLGAYVTLGEALQHCRGFDDPDLAKILAKISRLADTTPAGPSLLEPIWLLWRRYYVGMMLPEAQACARRLAELGDGLDDPAIRMIALSAEGVIAYFRGEPGRACEVLGAAVALWNPETMLQDASGIPAKAAFFAHLFLANALVLYGEARSAAGIFAVADEMAEAAHSPDLCLMVGIYRQMAMLALGDYERCSEQNRADLDRARRHELYHQVALTRLVHAVLLAKRDETTAAQAVAQELESFFGPFASTSNGRIYLLMLIELGFATGDHSQIPACIDTLRTGMKRLSTHHFLAHTEEAALALNWPADRHAAQRLAEETIEVLIATGNRVPHLKFATTLAGLQLAAGDAAAARGTLKRALAPLDPEELADVPFYQAAQALLDQASDPMPAAEARAQ